MTKLLELFFNGMIRFLIYFFKGEWLANGFDFLSTVFELTKFFIYSLGIFILVSLGILSVGTFIYLISNAINYPLEAFKFFYDITGTVAKDEAAWGAFVVLAALTTFIHRERANNIQQENLRLQKTKWRYEKKQYDNND